MLFKYKLTCMINYFKFYNNYLKSHTIIFMIDIYNIKLKSHT